MPSLRRPPHDRRAAPRKATAAPAAAPVDFRLFFDALPALACVLDPDLRIVAASDAYAEAAMRPKADIVGRHIFDAFPDDPSDPSADGVRNLHASLAFVIKHRKPHAMAVQKYGVEDADGNFETRYWNAVNSPVLDPSTGALVYIIHRPEDVTDLVHARDRGARLQEERGRRVGAEHAIRHMEGELQRQADQLEHQSREMEMMDAELAFARDSANEASHIQSSSIASIRRELGGPLTGIIGFSDLLSATPMSSDQVDIVRMISDSARILFALINDVLDVSQLEPGKIAIEKATFSVGSVVLACERLLRGQAHMKSLQLDVIIDGSVPALVRGDPNRLRQILTTLLYNAVKFTDTGGVTLSVNRAFERDRRDKDVIRIRFEVEDSGTGIAESHLAGLFEPLSLSCGPCLSIVRTLVELMNGQVGVESAVGRGSVFWVDIPFSVVEQGSEAAAEAPIQRQIKTALKEQPVVLVVDGCSMIRRLVYQQLSQLGCGNVLTACNGKEALSKLETSGPVDLVLMECQLPDLDGCAAAIALREFESARGIAPVPVVVMTDSVLRRDHDTCLEAGMNDVLTKPFTLAELGSMLQKWLRYDGSPR
ncbi:Histidine kinase [Plasmodiophora brassicae]|uniref:Histidine kinase n=1 Tax=Plasmodiophora brassicae TaxID=37360 RepID=A0A0G4IJ77_PLABS|nr:hypothetical protein PBRA_004024 [Plasmodiophora brassicae]